MDGDRVERDAGDDVLCSLQVDDGDGIVVIPQWLVQPETFV